jgi:hypothetical protein
MSWVHSPLVERLVSPESLIGERGVSYLLRFGDRYHAVRVGEQLVISAAGSALRPASADH